jgi:AcrR family transcriptional regulator
MPSRRKPVLVKAGYHHGNLRAALIEAGLQVLREAGVEGLSLRECARRVGVTQAAPTNHFGGKRGLLNAIAEVGFARLGERMTHAAIAAADPVDRLPAIMKAYVEFACTDPALFELMFKSDLRQDGTEALRKAAIEAIAVLDRALSDFEAHTGGAKTARGEGSLAVWSLAHGLTQILLGGALPLRYGIRGAGALVESVVALFCRALAALPAMEGEAAPATASRQVRKPLARADVGARRTAAARADRPPKAEARRAR